MPPRPHSRRLVAALTLSAGLAVVTGAMAPSATAASRSPLDIRVFARVPEPGQPEPIAIGPHQRRVYVGTNQEGKGEADVPSKVFVYSRQGGLLRDIELRRQDLSDDHGIQGLAFDARRRLYALDRSATPRVVRINLRTGRQHDYASFRDVPPCTEPEQRGCSATVTDAEPTPDYPAFDRRGRLYVTDLEQALIWRVPKNGGSRGYGSPTRGSRTSSAPMGSSSSRLARSSSHAPPPLPPRGIPPPGRCSRCGSAVTAPPGP